MIKGLDKEELQAFALMTEEEYRVNLLLDNLPIAMPVYLEETADDGATTGKTQKLYQTGYPIGHAPGQDEQVLQKTLQRPSDKNLYLFNHLKFTVLYNDFHGPQKRRVVGFEVEPMSVKHTYDNQVDWDDQFHVWRMEWNAQKIVLSMDGKVLNTINLNQTNNSSDRGPKNPFHQPHYLLLNLAVGGKNGGEPDQTPFPSRYEIDYVRVYQKKN